MLTNIDYSNCFGVQIEDNLIRLAAVSKKGKGLKIDSYAERKLVPGIVNKGLVEKQKTLSDIIERAMHDCFPKPIKLKKVFCSVPEYKSFVKIIEMPTLDEEEIAGGVKWETEDNIPLPLERVYYDWQIFEKDLVANKSKVMLVAAPKDIIDSRLAALEGAGLLVIGFQPDSFALNRCFSPLGWELLLDKKMKKLSKKKLGKEENLKDKKQKSEENNKNEQAGYKVMVYVGKEKSIILVQKNYEIVFSSSLLFSTRQLKEEILKSLGDTAKNELDKKAEENPPDPQAKQTTGEDKQKQKRLKDLEKFGLDLSTPEGKKHYDAAKLAAKELTREVKSAFNYFEQGSNNVEIKEVYLTGSGANLKGLDTFLSKELGCVVLENQEFDSAKLFLKDLTMPHDLLSDYVIALGCAMLTNN